VSYQQSVPPDSPKSMAVRERGITGTAYSVHPEVLRGRGPVFFCFCAIFLGFPVSLARSSSA
ncbi:hypothetical protein, partial [Salmonella enterica]|uniref:hypothetical protein n=1 Tax=Salmonella enterica TaxID=28901 RepID=UPI0019D5E3CB